MIPTASMLDPGTGRPRAVRQALLVTAFVVVANNAIVAAGRPEGQSFVLSVLLGFLVVASTRWGQGGSTPVSMTELGLDRRTVGSGLRLGVLAAVITVVVVGAAVTIGGSVAGPPDDVWFRLLIVIPFASALTEELIFRGVLLALWDRVASARLSTALTSLAFGCWHVAAEVHRSPEVLSVLGGVAFTTLASALVLCPVRRRSRSIVVPVMIHASANSTALVVLHLTS